MDRRKPTTLRPMCRGGTATILAIQVIATCSAINAVAQGTYETSFGAPAENPLSEGGRWMGGHAAGQTCGGGYCWGDIQKDGTKAYGVDQPTSYGDPTALLTGTWGANQTAEATTRVVSRAGWTGCCHEVEVRLRSTIDPTTHTLTGYEVYCSADPNNAYCHIASWGGPNGVWVNLDDCKGQWLGTHLNDGQVLKGTVTGTNPVTITLYIDGVQKLQVQDDGNCVFNGDGQKHGPWTSGSPGIGFYGADWSSFGFTHFLATDGGRTVQPPTGLTATVN